jgi:hypothetical protein
MMDFENPVIRNEMKHSERISEVNLWLKIWSWEPECFGSRPRLGDRCVFDNFDKTRLKVCTHLVDGRRSM